MKVKRLRNTAPNRILEQLKEYPNFHKSGSIRGMKEMFYGIDALLVRSGDYIYNVTEKENIYHTYAY